MKRAIRILRSWPFLVAAGAVAFYALAGFIAAPWYIQRELPNYLRDNLHATGSVGEIKINPFALTLSVRNFAVTESGGKTPAIAFDHLFINFQSSSLFRRAWTFADITLERPRINLEIDANGTLNFSRLVPKHESPPAKENGDAKLPRLLLSRVAISGGSVAFTDRAVADSASARLAPVEFELHDLSTLPDRKGDYTLTAKLPAGGVFTWRGTLTLVPMASTGTINIRDLKLASLWRFAQQKLLIEAPAGSVDVSFGYHTRYSNNTLDASLKDLGLKLSGIAITQRGQSGIALDITEMALRSGNFDLATRNLHFPELTLNKARAHTVLDAQGGVNWAKLIAPGPATPAGAPWKVAIDSINVSDVALRTDDHGFVNPMTFEVGRAALKAALKIETGATPSVAVHGLSVNLNDLLARETASKDALVTLATLKLAGGNLDLARHKLRFTELAVTKGRVNMTVGSAGQHSWQRQLGDRPNIGESAEAKTAAPATPWQIVIDTVSANELSLHAVDQSYLRPLAFEVGRVDGRAGIGIESGDTLKLDIGSLAVDLEKIRLTEAGAKESLISLETAKLTGGKFNLARNRFTADSVKFAKASTRVIREADGSVNLTAAFTPKVAPKPSSASSKPVVVEIGTFQLQHGTVAMVDRGMDPALAVDLQSIRMLARTVGNAGKQAMTLDAALQIKQGGALRVRGTVSPTRQHASLRVEAKDILLAPIEALVAKHTTLILKSGSISSTGRIEWNGTSKPAKLHYSGNAAVDSLRLEEAVNGAKFASWKQLLAEDMKVDVFGASAHVGDLRLAAPTGKVVIAKDHSTNFSTILRTSKPAPAALAEPAAPTKSPATTTPVAQPSSSSAVYAVSIDRMHVSSGELDFTDNSLVLPFATVIQEMNGSITGLSTQPGTRAGVKLDGRVDEFGQALVSGSINPFAARKFSDVTVAFRNIALSPLTPYSVTFAGRRIASGKLSLDLQYKLTNSQLQGKNKVLLEQFTLGERVESPSAVNLPLDLAIALLTDSSGKIAITVPIRGNVDSPEFSYGHVVWQAINTLITNIVTAPFRALGALLGGSADNVDAIAFDAGRAQLAPPEREKLMKIAGVLKQRPNLKLLVQGRYDSRHDGAALRTQATRRLLAERLGIKVTGLGDAALPSYDNAKTQRAIEELYEARAGDGGVEKFKAEHEKKTGKEVKRVNAALALIGRSSPDREFYERLLARATELQALPESELHALATRRSNAVLEHLRTASGLDPSRFNTESPAKTEAGTTSAINAKLSLAPLKP